MPSGVYIRTKSMKGRCKGRCLNTGRTHFKKGHIPLNPFKKGHIPWSKGGGYKHKPHTEETKKKISVANTGKKHSEETKRNMSITRKGRKVSAETRKKISKNFLHFWRTVSEEKKKIMAEKQRQAHSGSKSTRWKGGLAKDSKLYQRYRRKLYKKKINANLKRYRHEKGISKKYREDLGNKSGISHTKERRKHYGQKYRALKRAGGELSIKRIQLVYEDNIKKYGTLTCYLCEKSLIFSKDHLEHKTPLSRGGTNEYTNLGVSCQRCNNRKHAKTEQEFRKEL